MRRILEMLCKSEYMSGEDMSRELGMTRAAVWKKIEALRLEGWNIESAGKRGYHLDAGDHIDPVLWEHILKTEILGRQTNFYAYSLDSTNRQVKQMGALVKDLGRMAVFSSEQDLPELSLSAMTMDALNHKAERFAAKGLDISTEIAPDIKVKADAAMMGRVLDELTDNMIKYAKTHVRLILKKEGERIPIFPPVMRIRSLTASPP